jgi:hypothetical protein
VRIQIKKETFYEGGETATETSANVKKSCDAIEMSTMSTENYGKVLHFICGSQKSKIKMLSRAALSSVLSVISHQKTRGEYF